MHETWHAHTQRGTVLYPRELARALATRTGSWRRRSSEVLCYQRFDPRGAQCNVSCLHRTLRAACRSIPSAESEPSDKPRLGQMRQCYVAEKDQEQGGPIRRWQCCKSRHLADGAKGQADARDGNCNASRNQSRTCLPARTANRRVPCWSAHSFRTASIPSRRS